MYNWRLLDQKEWESLSVDHEKANVRPLARRPWVTVLVFAVAALASGLSTADDSSAAKAGKEKTTTCSACHGVDGNSTTAQWPNLAGQHASYLVHQLQAFKTGERPNAAMKSFASMLSDQDMKDIAAYYASQKIKPLGANPKLVGLGEQIYRGGIPARGVAACISCHGPAGRGNPLAAFPRLSHQHADYILTALHEYASGTRRSDANHNQMMRNIAGSLFDNEMQAVASYVQGLQ